MNASKCAKWILWPAPATVTTWMRGFSRLSRSAVSSDTSGGSAPARITTVGAWTLRALCQDFSGSLSPYRTPATSARNATLHRCLGRRRIGRAHALFHLTPGGERGLQIGQLAARHEPRRIFDDQPPNIV